MSGKRDAALRSSESPRKKRKEAQPDLDAFFANPISPIRIGKTQDEIGFPTKEEKLNGNSRNLSPSFEAKYDGVRKKNGNQSHSIGKKQSSSNPREKVIESMTLGDDDDDEQDITDEDDLIIVEDNKSKEHTLKASIKQDVPDHPPLYASIFASKSKRPPKSNTVKDECTVSETMEAQSASSLRSIGAVSASPSKPTLTSYDESTLKKKAELKKSLDTSIYTFDPALDVDTSSWPKGRIPYSFLTEAFVQVSSTRSRLTIVRVLTNLLRVVVELDPGSLLDVIYLTTNRIGPAHERDNEMGIGSQVLGKAIREVSGLNQLAIKHLWNKHGDAGDLAYEASKSVRLLVSPPRLVCHSVYATLRDLSKLKGQGTQVSKVSLVKKLLIAAHGEEVRYITRTLVQNLRIGAVRLTLTTALARAFCLSRPEIENKDFEEPQDDFYISKALKKGMTDSEQREAVKKGKEKETEKEDPVRVLVEGRIACAEALVRKVWARHPDYAHIVDALLKYSLETLDERVPLAVGTPLQPMLGSITRSLSEVYTRLSSRPFVAEAKLDGQRAQMHVAVEQPIEESGKGRWYNPSPNSDGTRIWVRVFSRHLEDMTDKYPDLLPTLSAIVTRSQGTDEPLTSFIIDSEIVAIDPVNGAIKTFQELSYRSKKDVEMGDIKVRVGVYCYDLMLLNGKSLLSEPFRKRRSWLREKFSAVRSDDLRWAKWELMPCCEDNSPEKVKSFFDECLEMKAEGIMVKLLDEAEVEVEIKDEEEDSKDLISSPSKGGRRRTRRKVLPASYEPDKRADSWLKVKKDYMDDIGDSLDLVPIGAWHGSGRKASWWSPILLGCYDEESGDLTAVCKCISGFTDQFYKDLNIRYALGGDTCSRTKFPGVNLGISPRPDVFFLPQEVWEIRGADLTLSPVYPAAQGLVSDRGISFRFPRFIRIRDPADKGVENATSAEQLAEMYKGQAASGKIPPAAAGDDNDNLEDDGDIDDA